ncbi:MAG: hypothetical protein WBA10_18080 [Elainellaceae cyanobacterium]
MARAFFVGGAIATLIGEFKPPLNIMENPMAHIQINRFVWLALAIAGLLVAAVKSSDLAIADPNVDTAAPVAASVSGPWQPASAEDEGQILSYILQSPLGVAALNQLAIEGFISPTCDKTF